MDIECTKPIPTNKPFAEVVKCYNSLLSHPCVLLEREDFREH